MGSQFKYSNTGAQISFFHAAKKRIKGFSLFLEDLPGFVLTNHFDIVGEFNARDLINIMNNLMIALLCFFWLEIESICCGFTQVY